MPAHRPSHRIQVFRREDRPNEQMRAEERASSHDCHKTRRRESRRSSSIQHPAAYTTSQPGLKLTSLRWRDRSYRIGMKLCSLTVDPGSVAGKCFGQFRRREFNLWHG